MDRVVKEGTDVASFDTLVKIAQENLRNIEIKVVSELDINLSRDKIDDQFLKTF